MLTRSLSNRLRLLLGGAMLLLAALIGLIVHWRLIVWGDLEVWDEFIEHRRDLRTSLMLVATALFNPLSAVVLSLSLAVAVWWHRRAWRQAAYIVLTVGLASLITIVLKTAFRRGRPPEIDRLITETDFSFPSGHTTAATALVCALALVITLHRLSLVKELLVWAAAVAVAGTVAASRLYLGVHWFTDISAGALVGAGTALTLSVMLTPGASDPRPADREQP